MFGKKKFADDRSLLEDLKGLSFGGKIKHLWTYYWWTLVVLAVVIFFIDLGITSYRNRNTEILIGGFSINQVISEEGETYLTTDWRTALGAESALQNVTLAYAYFEDPNMAVSEDEMAATFQVIAMITAKELDYVLMDQAALEFYLNQDAFLPLENSLTQEQLAQFEDYLVYGTYGEDSTETVPLAIDISHLPFIDECTMNVKSVYIAFPGNRENAQSGAQVLDYLMNWKAE